MKKYIFTETRKEDDIFFGNRKRTGRLRKTEIFDSHTQVNFFGNFFSQLTKTSYFFRRELVSPRQALHQVRWEPNEQLPKILPRLHQNS